MYGRGFAAAALSAVLCVVAIAAVGPAAAQSRIGVTSAAQNAVEGVQGGATRALTPGADVFQDETVRTGAESMAQLLFLDETSLSIGPQSEVLLDRFIYDPATGAGEVVLETAKGAFRFITGSQDPTNYEIRTPFAAIGVRGTIVDCYASVIGLYCVAQEGTVIITIGGVTYTLAPGQALFVAANGAVTGPFPPDGEFFAVTGIMPFPLYGALLPGQHEEVEVPDGTEVRLDELFEQCTGEGCYEVEPCQEYPYCF